METDNPNFAAPVSGKGSKSDPWVIPHPNWGGIDENSKHVPAYGAWCKCGDCGIVERCTFMHDFYPTEDKRALRCEGCLLDRPNLNRAIVRELEKGTP